MYTCATCLREMPASEFGRDSRRTDGRCRTCKPCRRERGAHYRRGGARKRQPDEMIRRVYKLTLDQYLRMLESQGGGCAICGRPPSGKMLCVDHDHDCCPGRESCGKCVRGLLCIPCNSILVVAVERYSHLRETAEAYIAKARAAAE